MFVMNCGKAFSFAFTFSAARAGPGRSASYSMPP
jgi:hypothetical protein